MLVMLTYTCEWGVMRQFCICFSIDKEEGRVKIGFP